MNPNNHETTKARNHKNKTLRLFRVFVFSCSCGNAICEMASSQFLVRRIRLSTTEDTPVLRVHRGGEVSIATRELYTCAAEKLVTASASLSNVSNTLSTWVMARRSWMCLGILISYNA